MVGGVTRAGSREQGSDRFGEDVQIVAKPLDLPIRKGEGKELPAFRETDFRSRHRG
jgi:hypothetical protein